MSNKSFVLAFLIGFCLFPIMPSKADELTEDTKRRIDEIFAPFVTDSPGCALGITRDLRIVYEKGYGLASLEHNIPITPDTVFDIASLSKQFTAMAIIILSHEGKVSLDDDVRQYVPEVPDYGTPITIRDLIHHTSGLRDIYMLRTLMGLTEKDYFTGVEFLDLLARQRNLTFPTGDTWRYSNSGYILLSLIVERTTSKTLAEYAKEKIFEPLKMTHTHFHDDAALVVRGRASGYYGDKDQGFILGGTMLELVGDGGVLTTVKDLMRWDRDFYEGKVWRGDIKADMLAVGRLNNGKAVAVPNADPNEEKALYAGGLVLGERRGLPYLRHGGSFIGFRTDQIRFPEQKLGITVLCNLGEIDAGELSNRVADIFLEDVYPDPAPQSDQLQSGEPMMPDKEKVKALSEEILAAMPGLYRSYELDTDYRVVHAGDTLDFLIGRREKRLDFSEYAASPLSFVDSDAFGNEVFVFRILRDEASHRVKGFSMSLVGASALHFDRID